MTRNKVLGQKRGYAQSIKKKKKKITENKRGKCSMLEKNKSILMFSFVVMIFILFLCSLRIWSSSRSLEQ